MKKNYLLLALVAILSVFGLSSCTNDDVTESFEQNSGMITRTLPTIEIPSDWTKLSEDVLLETHYSVDQFVNENWYVKDGIYVGTDSEASITAALGDKNIKNLTFGEMIVDAYIRGNIYKTPQGTTVYVTTQIVINFDVVSHNGGQIN